MPLDILKAFKNFKIIKSIGNEKLPLVFATLKLYWISLSLDSWGNFLDHPVVTLRKSKGKSKRNSEFASLIKLFYSLRSI